MQLELNNSWTRTTPRSGDNQPDNNNISGNSSFGSSRGVGGAGAGPTRSTTTTTMLFGGDNSSNNGHGKNNGDSSLLAAAQESLLPQQQQLQRQLRRRDTGDYEQQQQHDTSDQVALLHNYSAPETTSTPCNSPSSPSYYYNHNNKNNNSFSKSVSFTNDSTYHSSSKDNNSSRSIPLTHSPSNQSSPKTNSNSSNDNSDTDTNDNTLQGSLRSFFDRRRQTLLALRGTSSIRLQRKLKMFDCMKRLGYCLAVSTFVLLLVAIPLLTIHAINEYNIGLDIGAFYSAGAFVILTIPISMYEIFLHLTHWYMPDVQKYVVRILWMVPLYSIQSWLSLRYHEFSLFIDTFRDMYEAFVIQSFLYYLIELLGGEDVLAGTLRLKGASEDDYQRHHGEHGWCLETFCRMRRWEMGEEFMLQCKHGVLQYVVIKVLATILTFLCKVLGEYGEGTMDLTKGYIYISFATNFSQMYALYVLIKLFYATKYELTHPVDWHPVGKFICVKGVVFFTWWQGAGIALLQEYGFIIDLGHWTADDVATGVQDYLVCLEMVFFAIAHTYTFTYLEYMNDAFNDPLLMPSHSIPPLFSNSTHEMNVMGGNHDYDPMTSTNGDHKNHRHKSHGTKSGTYRAPPVVRKLAQPQHFSKALWSSSIPTETFSDIYRIPQGRRKITAGPSAQPDASLSTTTTSTTAGPITQAVAGSIGDKTPGSNTLNLHQIV